MVTTTHSFGAPVPHLPDGSDPLTADVQRTDGPEPEPEPEEQATVPDEPMERAVTPRKRRS